MERGNPRSRPEWNVTVSDAMRSIFLVQDVFVIVYRHAK